MGLLMINMRGSKLFVILIFSPSRTKSYISESFEGVMGEHTTGLTRTKTCTNSRVTSITLASIRGIERFPHWRYRVVNGFTDSRSILQQRSDRVFDSSNWEF